MFSRSVDIILYLVSREARSLASASDRVGLVGMVQSNLQLVDLSLELLLDTESLTLGSLLSLNGGSKRLHGAGVVLPGVVELLLLLRLQHAALFVQSVDGAAALTKLVKQI